MNATCKIGAVFIAVAICRQSVAIADTLTYTYDFLHRVTQVQYGNGTTINYIYDAAGNRLTQVISVVAQNFLLTVTDPANGTVTGSGIGCPGDCTENVASGTNVVLTATPTTGYQIDTWTGCQIVNGNKCTVQMTQARTVTVTFAVIADHAPPAAVTNLAASTPTVASIMLSWNAPGDDGNSGTATSYDIRYALSQITELNWASATQVSGEPAPLAAGSTQNFTITGLSCSTKIFFALKTSDEVSNTSPVSNSPSSTTLPCPPNQAPNGTIVSPAANVTIVAGQTVDFQGTGSDPDGNLPLTYSWNFGGGAANSSAQNPGPVLFNVSGTYAVSFTVTDALGLADPTPATRTVKVNANAAPDGAIVSPTSNVTIFAGQSVNFQGSGTDANDNLPLTYLWSFGAGSGIGNSSLQNPGPVKFNSPGVFTATLTVTDSVGLADPTPATRVITVNPRPALLFVEPSALCGGNNPCLSSIQQAIDIAALDATIRVARGRYRENVRVVGPADIKLQGGWESIFVNRTIDPSLSIIDGDVTGDGVGEGKVFSIEASGTTVVVDVESFTILNGSGENGAGIYAFSSAGGAVDLILNGNLIRNNRSSNAGGGVGIFSQDAGSSSQTTLINNLIFANDSEGRAGGLYAYSSQDSNTTASLINNTITNNAATGVGGGVRAYSDNGASTKITIKNSIVWGNSGSDGHDIAVRNSLGGSTVVNASYSDIGDVLADADAPGTFNDLGNNIDADPLFLDFSGGDLRLGFGSPAIDSATSSGAPNVDFEGDPRPQQASHDIGADEWKAEPLAITAVSVPTGEVDVAYNVSLGVHGGQPPYSTTILSGVLPAGLALSGQSILGTPTSTGRPRFTIKVTDQLGSIVSRVFTLRVNAHVSITSTTLPVARLGRSYRGSLRAKGGLRPYSWSFVSGNLPPEFTLNSSNGQITGSATVAASYNFTLQVIDVLGGVAQKDFTLTVQ